MHRAIVSIAVAVAITAALGEGVRADDSDPSGQAIYRYRNAKGRIVYTNAVEQVPLAERAASKLDLRKVALNTEVGNEIEQRLEEEHAKLTASPYCKALVRNANFGFLARLWEDFAPLIVCGGALLAFLIFTPSALRRFGAPAWAKVLCMAIPSLAIAGLLMFSMNYTSKTMAKLKDQAKPCIADTFAGLGAQKDALFQQAKLVETLKQQVAAIDAAAGTVLKERGM